MCSSSPPVNNIHCVRLCLAGRQQAEPRCHLYNPGSWSSICPRESLCWWHLFCIYLIMWRYGLSQALDIDLWRGKAIPVLPWMVMISEEFVTEQKARSVKNKVLFFFPNQCHCEDLDLITPIIYSSHLGCLLLGVKHAGHVMGVFICSRRETLTTSISGVKTWGVCLHLIQRAPMQWQALLSAYWCMFSGCFKKALVSSWWQRG